MTEIETAWCPCQEEEYDDLPERDLQYVVTFLQEVKSEWYYEQKRKKARKNARDFAVGVGPSTPRTKRGEKIIDENFPEADLLCPICEQGYEEEIERTVTPVEE